MSSNAAAALDMITLHERELSNCGRRWQFPRMLIEPVSSWAARTREQAFAETSVSYNVADGEVLSYREMVERIFAAMGKPPRFVRAPLPVFEWAARIARLHLRYRHIRSSMAERMEQDMTFSNAEAISDFGYAPRRFEPVAQ